LTLKTADLCNNRVYSTRLIAQVADLHIKAEGRLAYRRVDTGANLERRIRHLMWLKQLSDLALMNGDPTGFGRKDEHRV